jgi:hypothetical protein
VPQCVHRDVFGGEAGTGGRRGGNVRGEAMFDCVAGRGLSVRAAEQAYPRSGQQTAIWFLDYVLSRLPFQVERIQTGNG